MVRNTLKGNIKTQNQEEAAKMNESDIFSGEMESFEIHHTKVDDKYSRVITVKMRSKGKESALVFKGVYDTGDISFSSFGEIMVRVTDLSDRGWDGLSISVEEIIDQSFLFYCDEFVAKVT